MNIKVTAFTESQKFYYTVVFSSSQHVVDPLLEQEDLKVLKAISGSRGGDRGSGPPPLKNQKNIGFLSNTGLNPLENHKTTKLAFNVGPLSADGCPLIVVLGYSLLN